MREGWGALNRELCLSDIMAQGVGTYLGEGAYMRKYCMSITQGLTH